MAHKCNECPFHEKRTYDNEKTSFFCSSEDKEIGVFGKGELVKMPEFCPFHEFSTKVTTFNEFVDSVLEVAQIVNVYYLMDKLKIGKKRAYGVINRLLLEGRLTKDKVRGFYVVR